MLGGALSSWAYNRDWTESFGINLKGEQDSPHQYLISNRAGGFATWCSDQTTERGFLTSTNSTKTVFHVQGLVNAADVAAICNYLNNQTNYKVLDFSQATGITSSDLLDEYENVRWADGIWAILPENSSELTAAQIGKIYNKGKLFGFYDSVSTDLLYINTQGSYDNLNPILGEDKGISFLPAYNSDGSLGYTPYIWNNSLPSQLANVVVGSIDFTWVTTQMSTDFTVLNDATHYIVVPVNGDYDFTNETQQNWGKYNYGTVDDDIYVVSTIKNNQSPYGTSCLYDGFKFSATELTNITYVRKAGTLGAAENFVSKNMREATRQIFCGTLNSNDLTAMEDIRSIKFDFTHANVTGMSEFSNNYVKYLALPDNSSDLIGVQNADVCAFLNVADKTNSKCPSLCCVGSYNTATNTLTTWSGEVGGVYSVTTMIRPQLDEYTDANGQKQTNQRGKNNICSTLENVVMSGRLNWDDISANNGNGKNNGLESATVKTADMTYAYFPTNSDMVFSTASWGSIEQITLPNNANQTEIPALCLNNCKKLDATICIPYFYKKIGTNAFNNVPMTHVTATDAEGKVVDYGNKTFTLPAQLELIQSGAFWTSDETISDVYILATKAPKCEANAFSAGGLYGWGGFGGNNTHPMCRQVYWNGSSKQFTMLHFPSDVTLDEAKKYTDVTRDYTLWDETGDYNGLGELRVWPNFSEIYRAYNQAVHGVTWNATGWDLTRSKANLNDIPCWPTSYKNAEGTTVTVKNTYDASVLIPASTTPATSEEAGGYVYDTDYMGWHQFVLADYYRYQEVEIPEAEEYVDGGWYTLCIPYDLTEAEVIRLMGCPADATYTGKGYEIASGDNAGCHLPTVYSLKKVTRQYPNIKLGFSQDLMKQISLNNKNLKFNEDGTITLEDETYSNPKKDGKIFIKGGYPYLVRPIFPKGFDEATNVNGNLGKLILSVSSFTTDDLGNKRGEGETATAAPIITQKVIAVDNAGHQVTYTEDVKSGDFILANAGDPYYYFFQGTYTPQRMPEAYYLNNSKWYRQTTAGTRDWESYTAIVGGKTSATGASYATASGATAGSGKDFSTWFVLFNAYKDLFTHINQNDTKFQITFEDENGFEELVAIDQINGKSLNSLNAEGEVYNVAGQRVSNSLEGLSKGLYIVNGKKVLVK